MDSLKNSANLVFLTNRVGRQLARLCVAQIDFAGFEAQGTHIGLLADLIVHDGQRQQDLAITGVKDKATIARSVQQMENAGLITRSNDTIDRRQKMIFITKKGRKLWKVAQSVMYEVLEEVTHDVDPDKLATCIEVLNNVYQAQRQPTRYAKQANHE